MGPRFDHVTFVTQKDRRALLARAQSRSLGHDRTTVIPICVDTRPVKPVPPVANPRRVTHIGTMHWPPNVEGILWIWERGWPRVQAHIPDARLTGIGKTPPGPIRALDQQAEVDVPGFVQDPTPCLEQTAAFIVPLHAAGGMRVKIVDAWYWGLTVVSTTIGAEGNDIRGRENILIADTQAGFAQAIVQVLRHAELRKRLRTNGQKWVEEHYDLRQVYGAWDEVYSRLV